MKKILIVPFVIIGFLSGWFLNDIYRKYEELNATVLVVEENTIFRQFGVQWVGEPGLYHKGERVTMKEVDGDRVAFLIYEGEASYWSL